MQGFNRYIPPNYDPKQHSTLNSHQGKKHALGKRAKDIDKGVLIVRFELPFNIWCGTCGNHIGAGVRYNAQKRKVGNYYSTPIFAFRCKCHLCSGWFEIRTDPQNSAYIVEEGAKRKEEDWNPEEHGGYAARDSEAPSATDAAAADPIAALEKTIDQQQWAKSNASRLTELTDHSARLASDPYAVSLNLRRRFREEKKELLEKQKRDDGVREKYGLHEDVELGEEEVEKGREMWEAGRERRGLPVDERDEEGEAEDASGIATPGTSRLSLGGMSTPGARPVGWGGKGKGATGNGGSPTLAQVLRKTTARRYDPFAAEVDGLVVRKARGAITPKPAKVKDPALPSSGPQPAPPAQVSVGIGMVAGYDSD